MRIIVTGGTGSVGVPLVQELAQAGHEVVVLTRSAAKAAAISASGRWSPRVRSLVWDGRTAAGWGDQVDGDSAIVNLAGENIGQGRWTPEFRQRVLQSRLDAAAAITQSITQAAAPPRVLIQASAVGHYGPRGDEPITEDTPPVADFRASVTVQWEAATADLPIRQCVLRIGIVLDRHAGALPPFLLASRFLASRLGDGRQYIPWIHHADTSGVIRFLIEQANASGVYNVCSPEPATNAAFFQSLAQVRHSLALFPVPGTVIRLAAGEKANAVLDSQRVIPKRLLEAGYRFRFPQLTDALRDLLNPSGA